MRYEIWGADADDGPVVFHDLDSTLAALRELPDLSFLDVYEYDGQGGMSGYHADDFLFIHEG